MGWFDVWWVFPADVDDLRDSNVHHIALNELTVEDVESALENPVSDEGESDSSGRPLIFGPARDGRLIAVVYEWIDEATLYPVTAFRVEKDE